MRERSSKSQRDRWKANAASDDLSGSDALFEYQKELLSQEIERIGDNIEHLDNTCFKVRAAAITLVAATLGWAVQAREASLALVALPIVFACYLLDAIHKRRQMHSRKRMRRIEHFLNNMAEFEHDGLREAFQRRSFGTFLVYDPVGRMGHAQERRHDVSRSRRLAARLTRNLLEVLRCMGMTTLLALYLVLLLSILSVALFLNSP